LQPKSHQTSSLLFVSGFQMEYQWFTAVRRADAVLGERLLNEHKGHLGVSQCACFAAGRVKVVLCLFLRAQMSTVRLLALHSATAQL
jgi:hypothetical protein